MKHLIKLVVITVICLSQWSCNNDDDTTSTPSETNSALVGEWLRSDNLINPNIEYKITLLDTDGNGIITDLQITDQGTISSANQITWYVSDNMLHMSLNDDTEMTSTVQFIDNEKIILANISDHYFIKQ
ncbi:hypothetical protein JAO71_02695 [Olleya sp. YSTF-M6]|uniref:Lipocalin-like domain-containing protein n=1 Tax=Olleya sediminilitoris TaxID=2795739 RepID=A0ABS1WHU9_9FLAO|nr:hypothetical protein [Olleya sediminilitoris]MBL7558699.1 hypothetical protein [Olleya sediminilitoris]